MKGSSGSNQTALNHAKHPIESRPSVVPYLERHQPASPWITGNQRSLRFANMCCLVVTSLLSNLAWKDMEKQKQQLQTWKHAAFLQETSTKSDTEDRNWNGFTDGATWTTKPQAIARQWEALAVWFGCLEAIHRSIQPQIHCGVGRFCSLKQEWTHRKLMKADELRFSSWTT